MHDARAVAPNELEQDQMPFLDALLDAAFDHDAKPVGPKRLERLGQRIRLRGGNARSKNPRELTRQPGHPALDPVPAVFLDRSRHRLDQPRPVLPNQRHDE